MAKFLIDETIHSEKVLTVRLGGNTAPARFTDADVGKPVKLVGESAYALPAAADPIEGFVSSINSGPTYDGFAVGGIYNTGYKRVTVVGATLAIGDFVVAAAPTALNTKLAAYAQVQQVAPATAATHAYKWRVVSLGTTGTGVAGSWVVIERV
jgi:hypothetical protein